MQNQPMQDTFIEKPSSAANETLEDYTLRYAPYSFRRWSPKVVAITALGGIAYLADFSIGAGIGMTYGTTNAIFSILFAALIIFLTGLPLAYYAARYNIDLDLITRGVGFGYFGSVLTSIIFASFTLFSSLSKVLSWLKAYCLGSNSFMDGLSHFYYYGYSIGHLWDESLKYFTSLDHTYLVDLNDWPCCLFD